MNMPALTAEELLRWNEATTGAFRKLLGEHPEALELPCDIRGGQSVRDLLQHIVAAELRYSERLAREPVTEYEAVIKDSAEALFRTHDRALSKLRQLLAAADYPWEEGLDLKTRSEGSLIATRRAVFAHALLHSIRHYAQLATLLRPHGIVAEHPLDYLFVSARFGEPKPRKRKCPALRRGIVVHR